jgi:hypothetical protein
MLVDSVKRTAVIVDVMKKLAMAQLLTHEEIRVINEEIEAIEQEVGLMADEMTVKLLAKDRPRVSMAS